MAITSQPFVRFPANRGLVADHFGRQSALSENTGSNEGRWFFQFAIKNFNAGLLIMGNNIFTECWSLISDYSKGWVFLYTTNANEQEVERSARAAIERLSSTVEHSTTFFACRRNGLIEWSTGRQDSWADWTPGQTGQLDILDAWTAGQIGRLDNWTDWDA